MSYWRARIGRWSVVLGLSACSALVHPERGPIECRVKSGDTDPCPDNTACVDGTCQPCKPGGREMCKDEIDNDCDHQIDEQIPDQMDMCDGDDNDCDGETDEDAKKQTEKCDGEDNDCDGETDESWDRDGDGVTLCGKDGLFDPKMRDCEDNNANAYPGNKEVCDGLNNDCDGDTDEDTCPANQICQGNGCVMRGCDAPNSNVTCAVGERCIEGRCTKVTPACPVCKDSQVCDVMSNTCVDRRKNGDGCAADSDCASGSSCVTASAFKLASAPAQRICAKACCSDGDCATPGETCFASGTGARSCLPRTLAANLTMTGTVQRTCASNEQCLVAQTACGILDSFQSGRQLVTPVCRNSAASERALNDLCANDNECSSRICMQLIISDVCTAMCSTSADCTKLADRGGVARGFCQYVETSRYAPGAAGNYAPICLAHYDFDLYPVRPPANGCASPLECPDEVCIGSSSNPPRRGQCATVCCNDTNCTGTPGARCLPLARGTGRFEMRCLVPPLP